MARVYVAIGSNLGDRRANIDTAIDLLKRNDAVRVVKVSSIYETEPVGGPPQGKFLNGVMELETDVSPRELLAELNGIEDRLGRKRREMFGPREIDLDIILYGEETIDEPGLTIPHPRMREREFVMRGLTEIAPHLGG